MAAEYNHILDRISELYAHSGIKSITMGDISNEFGISKKTIYHFVHDKTQLIEQVLMHTTRKKQEKINLILEKGLNAIRQLYELMWEINSDMKTYNPVMENDLKKYYPLIYEKVINRRKDFLFLIIVKNIRKGKAEGLYRHDLNENIIARYHLSKIMQMPGDRILSAEDYLLPGSFTELFDFHVRGLATGKGIKTMKEILKTINKELLKNTENK